MQFTVPYIGRFYRDRILGHQFNKRLESFAHASHSSTVTKLKKVNISSCPKFAQYLLKKAVKILRYVGGLCRPLQVFRPNHLFEEFGHQAKDDVKLTSAQMSQLVSLWLFADSENPTVHCKKRFAEV
jgi:hypothetical protein